MEINHTAREERSAARAVATERIALQRHSALVGSGVSAPPDEQLGGELSQDVFNALTETCSRIAGEICERVETDLPGITNGFREQVLVVLGGQALGAYGSYQPEKWQLDGCAVDEIHLNVGFFMFAGMDSRARAEEVLDTICHELAHRYARITGRRDTSGRGNRYHNGIFARIAGILGLRVEKSPRSYIGHITTGLSATGWQRYGDLIAELEQALRLLPADGLARRVGAAPSVAVGTMTGTPADESGTSKYVSAQCSCRDERGRPRTIRMARGWWLEGTVGCAICQQVFVESPPDRTKPTTAHPNRVR